MAVAHSLASHLATANLIVKVWDPQGLAGWGEGVPRSYVTGEDIDASLGFLARQALPRLLGREMPQAEPKQSDPLSQALLLSSQAFSAAEADRYPAAACALETALWDLAARRAGEPLSWLLGGAKRPSLTYSGVFPQLPLTALAPFLEAARQMRVDEIKLKVGGADDLERVALVRQTLGPRAKLRVDANGAWSESQALERMAALGEWGVHEVEQPVPAQNPQALTRVAGQSQALVLADESLCTLEQARGLAQAGVRLGFNLRLSKCGGLARSLEILKIAQDQGLPCQLGCQVGELGILSAAGRHFAACVPGLIHIEGSLTRFFLDRDICAQNLTFGAGGQAPALQGPGLGIEIDEQALGDSLFSSS